MLQATHDACTHLMHRTSKHNPLHTCIPTDEDYIASVLQPPGQAVQGPTISIGAPGSCAAPPLPPMLGLYAQAPAASAATGATETAPTPLMLKPAAPLYTFELHPAALGSSSEASVAGPRSSSSGGYGFRPDGFGGTNGGSVGGTGTPPTVGSTSVRVTPAAGGGLLRSAATASAAGADKAMGVAAEGGTRARARSAHAAAVDSLGLRLVALEERRAALAARLARSSVGEGGGGGEEPGGRQELDRLTATINRCEVVAAVRLRSPRPLNPSSLSPAQSDAQKLTTHLPRTHAAVGSVSRPAQMSGTHALLLPTSCWVLRRGMLSPLEAARFRTAWGKVAMQVSTCLGQAGSGHGLHISDMRHRPAAVLTPQYITNTCAEGQPATPDVTGAVTAALASGISSLSLPASGGPAAAAAAAAGAAGHAWRPRGVLVRAFEDGNAAHLL